ncbi:hypothetical protein pb186bvf_002306 [Paramecium bursaria]
MNILFLGNTKVGKSTIICRYLENKYINVQPTTEVEKHQADSSYIIDTNGQNRHCAHSEYKHANCVVLVFDVTNQESFIDLQGWHGECLHYNNKIPYWIVVGNKIDLKEQKKVSKDEAQRYSDKIGAKYFECSAVTPKNINMIFLTISQLAQMQLQPRILSQLPEAGQKLLLQHEEQPKVLQASKHSKKIKQANNNFSFDESVNTDSIQDYFTNLIKKTDKNAQNLAEQLVKDSNQKIQVKLKDKGIINPSKHTIHETSIQKQIKNIDLPVMEQKLKQLDKLRRELDQNLYIVIQQKKDLRVDQSIENQQLTKVEKELSKRLKSVENGIDLLRTDVLLAQKTHHFSSNQSQFQSINQSMNLKAQISQIVDPEHMKEQNEQIRKIMSERKKLQKIRESRFQKNQSLIIQEQKDLEEKEKKKKQEEAIKKKEQIIERMQSLEKISKERESTFKKQNEELKKLIKNEPLHKKLEDKFKLEFIDKDNQTLEQKLQQIKDACKPIRIDELKNWEDDYEKKLKQKELLRKEKLNERNKISYKASFESKQYQDAKNEVYAKQKEMEQQQLESTKKIKATQEFTQKLKDFLPQISTEKQQEMEAIIGKLHHQKDYLEYIEMAKKVKQKGVFFDQTGKPLNREIDDQHYEKLKEQDREDNQLTPRTKGNKYLDESKKFLKKPISHQNSNQRNSSVESTIQDKKPKESQFRNLKQTWQLKKLDPFNEEKLERVLQQDDLNGIKSRTVVGETNKLTENALKRIEVLSAKGIHISNMSEIQSAEQVIVNSIKAKLQLLDRTLEHEKQSPPKRIKRSISKPTSQKF